MPVFVKHSDWQLPEDTLWNSQQSRENSQSPDASDTDRRTDGPEFSYLLEISSRGEHPLLTALETEELPIDAANRLFVKLKEDLNLDPALCLSIPRAIGLLEDPASRQCVFVYTVAIPELVAVSQVILAAQNFVAERLMSKEDLEVLHAAASELSDESSHLPGNFSLRLNYLTRVHTIKHWSDSIASTTAATELLPKFFTINQLKDVYLALFLLKGLDPTNFKRWAVDANRKILVAPANDAEIKSAVVGTIMSDLTESQAGSSLFEQLKPDAIRETLNSNIVVGASPMLKGTPESRDLIKYLPPIVTNAIVKSSATVAFQHLKQGVTVKYWYQTESSTRTYLRDKFGTKPTWIVEGTPAD